MANWIILTNRVSEDQRISGAEAWIIGGAEDRGTRGSEDWIN